tara:strand:+ start:243 stop:917 length:675 start_codon:yes stop_codon:yes gene_type:complete
MEEILPIVGQLNIIYEEKVKEFDDLNKELPLLINYLINEGIKLEMTRFEITNELNNILKTNEGVPKNYKIIINRLIVARFTISITNKVKKTKLTNKNLIFNNTLDFINDKLKRDNINIYNIISNIYDISQEILVFINKYSIADEEKNKIIIQVLLNIIEDLTVNLMNIDEKTEQLIKEVKQIISDTLPLYIKSFVEMDLNDEAIIETQKHCIKMLFMCLSNKSV